MKTALITGVNGQDGSYLAEFLLNKNYKVVGLTRRTVVSNQEKLKNLENVINNQNFLIESGDVTDSSSIWRLIDKYKPHEIYNLAAQSHVGESFLSPISTTQINAIGPLNILEAIKNTDKNIKFYQASTSEMFGDKGGIQNENTYLSPVSPYACSKVYAHNLTQLYRKSYGIFSCSGILFNHESPRRGENFVTRKITKAVARIKLGKQDRLELGNLQAMRDWGFAGDYVEAMWKMLQHSEPDDYIISTGETNSINKFLEIVFELANLEKEKYVTINQNLFRPHDVPYLLGDSTKAREKLDWEHKINIYQLAKMMYENDLLLEAEK